MLTEDVIRKAVKIAPGFEWVNEHYFTSPMGPLCPHRNGIDGNFDELPELRAIVNVGLDALAAALVRVVDAVDSYCVVSCDEFTTIDMRVNEGDREWHPYLHSEGPDRTENTINAIVEFSESHPEVFK